MKLEYADNKVFKYLLKISLAIVMFISIAFITHPITALADGESGLQWKVDSEGNQYVYSPGKLYWAGDSHRTGLLFYCVDTETGKEVESTQTVIYNNMIDESGTDWRGLVKASGTSRFNVTVGNTRVFYYPDMPNAAEWDSDGSTVVKDWLESDSGAKDSDGRILSNGAKLVYLYIGNKEYKNVVSGKYAVCFEGMVAMSIYKQIDGLDVAYTLRKDIAREKYPDATDEELAELAVIKDFTTVNFYAYLSKYLGVDITQRYGETGTANYKWIQSSAKYFSTSEEHFGIPAAYKAGADVTAEEIKKSGWSFAVIETIKPPLHTYNGTSSPGNTEPPETDVTDGDCKIRKIYYTQVEKANGTVDTPYKDVKTFTQADTTGYYCYYCYFYD